MAIKRPNTLHLSSRTQGYPLTEFGTQHTQTPVVTPSPVISPSPMTPVVTTSPIILDPPVNILSDISYPFSPRPAPRKFVDSSTQTDPTYVEMMVSY